MPAASEILSETSAFNIHFSDRHLVFSCNFTVKNAIDGFCLRSLIELPEGNIDQRKRLFIYRMSSISQITNCFFRSGICHLSYVPLFYDF